MNYEIWECTHPACALRIPVGEREHVSWRGTCPRCHSAARLAGTYPANGEENPVDLLEEPVPPANPVPMAALLDNIRSTWNVGAMFRTADGAGFSALYLCGITATPEHPKVANTALGAHAVVPWHYRANGLHTAQELKQQGWRLWALECGVMGAETQTGSIFGETLQSASSAPILLIVGNERFGVEPDILKLCERAVWIPMQGQKSSLNVAVAFGIAAYTLRFGRLMV
ncbi:MAG: TrmH family RNA methyltransferase [Chloroflexota bacterium]